MLKLIKYEFIKKYKLLLMLLVLAVLINLGLGILKGEGGMTIFLVLFPLVLGIIFLYELIKTYSDDLNKKTGYMLFMTPNSGYKIIGSKLVTIILEGILFILTYALFATINLAIMAYMFSGDFSLILEVMSQLVEGLNMLVSGTLGINLGDLALIFIMIMVSGIVFVLTVYTAITIRRSIFSNNKLSGILSFAIFIIINVIYANLIDLVGKIFRFENIIIETGSNLTTYPSSQMFTIFTAMIVFNTIIGALLMLGSGYLVEKKINL